MRRILMILLAALVLSSVSDDANACTIRRLQSVTGRTTDLGTYNANAPGVQTLTLTITLRKQNNGLCTATIAFNSVVIPAQLTGPGASTLDYDVQTTGGASLLYTATPGNRITLTGFANGQNTITFTTTVQVGALAGQGGLRAGNYSDNSVDIRAFDGNSITPVNGARALRVSATVVANCTINGFNTGAADSATIPVSSSGVVDISPIVRAFANVACSSQSTVQLSSLSGGVARAAAAPAGFSDIIDYIASASFAGAVSTLDTSTTPSASGTELGTVGTTGSSTPTGTLSVVITPQTPGQPLAAGNFTDTLRITITPL